MWLKREGEEALREKRKLEWREEEINYKREWMQKQTWSKWKSKKTKMWENYIVRNSAYKKEREKEETLKKPNEKWKKKREWRDEKINCKRGRL